VFDSARPAHHRLLLVCALSPVLGAVACVDQGFNVITKTETFQQAPSNEVDILWIIDNSVSMVQEQTAVANGGTQFISHLEETGMDFHLGVITSDMDLTNANAATLVSGYITNVTPNYQSVFAQRVQVGTGGSDQEKGMDAARAALTPPLTSTKNIGFLRDDASLAIIVLSDENDCSDGGALGPDSTGEECYTKYDKLEPIPDLVRDLKEIKRGSIGSFTFSGIIGPDAVDGCPDAVPGKRYATAIQMIGGVRANICDADYTSIMDSLGLIAAGVLDTFPLENLADPTTIEVSVSDVDGVPFPEVQDATNGWTYEEAADQSYANIVFHGTGIPPRGADITVDYVFAGRLSEPDTGA
jgi:hypothetical protein